MIDVILDTALDGLKLFPFLFITFLILELIEHKLSAKSRHAIERAGRIGPVVGGLFGAFPQCGFSVMATNLYATRIISVGTLVAIYLSTSDEMLPILLSEGTHISQIIKIVGLKVVIGIFIGMILDLFFFRKKENDEDNEHIHHMCEHEHCDCEKSIFKSSLKHSLKIFAFIVVISFIINIGFHFLGEDVLSKLFLKNSIFGPFVASLVGLIPNCGASVAVTQLYLSGALSFGSAMAGLLTGSGVALLVLFKMNKSMKDNLFILLTVYASGVLVGEIIDILGIVI